MRDEQKKEFTARIVNANRTDLVVIKYEMIFAYMDDAKADFEAGNWELVKADFHCMEKILDRFMKDLDFTYEISNELYCLYRFCMEKIAMCRVRKNLAGMDEVKMVLTKLHQAFVEVAKTDESAPLMSGATQIVAGMTYGKNSLNETYSNDLNKGYII